MSLLPTPWRVAAYAVVGLTAVVMVVPFLYIISASVRTESSLFTFPPEWIPSPLDFSNYSELFNDQPFLRWTFNTLFVATTITIVKLLLDSMAAYAFANLEFRGKGVIFWVMLSTILMPIGVLIVPLFFIVRDLGWLDTYWALIIPPLANPVGIFMLRAFITQLPNELDQAARVDNCSPFQTYWRVILPLIKPGLVVVGMYQFLLQYTSFIWPLVAVDSPDMLVLTTGISLLSPIAFLRDWGLLSAAMVLTMVPITLVFLLFQRQFLSVSLSGALKA